MIQVARGKAKFHNIILLILINTDCKNMYKILYYLSNKFFEKSMKLKIIIQKYYYLIELINIVYQNTFNIKKYIQKEQIGIIGRLIIRVKHYRTYKSKKTNKI